MTTAAAPTFEELERALDDLLALQRRVGRRHGMRVQEGPFAGTRDEAEDAALAARRDFLDLLRKATA